MNGKIGKIIYYLVHAKMDLLLSLVIYYKGSMFLNDSMYIEGVGFIVVAMGFLVLAICSIMFLVDAIKL